MGDTPLQPRVTRVPRSMDDDTHKSLRGGRPRKDTSKLRSEWLRVRVTVDELHQVEQRAVEARLTPSDYVRHAVLDGRIEIKHPAASDPGTIIELQRIGNNLNQIARICNTTGNDRRARFIELHIDEELRPLLKLLLERYAP